MTCYDYEKKKKLVLQFVSSADIADLGLPLGAALQFIEVLQCAVCGWTSESCQQMPRIPPQTPYFLPPGL
jgi:hypothetical protein